jgi:hypothetical protein
MTPSVLHFVTVHGPESGACPGRAGPRRNVSGDNGLQKFRLVNQEESDTSSSSLMSRASCGDLRIFRTFPGTSTVFTAGPAIPDMKKSRFADTWRSAGSGTVFRSSWAEAGVCACCTSSRRNRAGIATQIGRDRKFTPLQMHTLFQGIRSRVLNTNLP